MRSIRFINQSTLVANADFQRMVSALGRQANGVFADIWGIYAALSGITVSPRVPYVAPPNQEVIRLLDHADQAGALGYHLLRDDAVPEGFCFAADCLADRVSVSSCLSHELLEQLLDPLASAGCVVRLPRGFGADAGRAAVVAYEVCDPVENDSYYIDLRDQKPPVEVSSFVQPSWFLSTYNPQTVTKFDLLGRLTAPLTLTPGGYVSFTTDLRSWSSAQAEKHKDKRMRFSRKARRQARSQARSQETGVRRQEKNNA